MEHLLQLYTSVRIISATFEYPHKAPTTTPTVILIAAQTRAKANDVWAPTQIPLNKESPHLLVPKIHLISKPNIAIALDGESS